MYHVNVSGLDNQRSFLREIGCFGNRGKIIPQILNALDDIQANTNVDTLPREIWSTLIKGLKEDLEISWREFYSILKRSYAGSAGFKSSISRTRLAWICRVFSDYEPALATTGPALSLYEVPKSATNNYQKLLELSESDVFMDEIVAIVELEEEDVYDATVDVVHNFVANDIIVHNSIEQDADIVMFLLRREYYDPLDKPGMAELIVAKNRHGGIGNVNLTYRKEIAQFANYTPIQTQVAYDSEAENAFKAFTPN
jgi:replicative DNA helicase